MDKPEKKNVISVKWIYKIKTNASKNHIKHKVWLVVRGFSQEYGVDYLEKLSHVSKNDTIKTILAYICGSNEVVLVSDGCKVSISQRGTKGRMYVTQPLGYVMQGNEHKVLRIHKTLYGLKQALRTWHGRIDSYFIQNDFERSMNDAALYVMKQG